MPVDCRSSLARRVAAHGAHAAVCVADRCAVKQIEETGEERIPEPRQQSHRARLHALHAVAHHELRPGVQFRDEARDLREVVRQVGVDHHHVVTGGVLESRQISAPVPAPVLDDDRRARAPRQVGAPVIRRVVDDDHLAVDPVFREDTNC